MEPGGVSPLESGSGFGWVGWVGWDAMKLRNVGHLP